MKLNPKENDISKCVNTDQGRLGLCQPYLEETGELVATNGHIMAILPGIKGDDDSAGFIPLEAIKAASGDEFKANGSCQFTDGRSFPRPYAPGSSHERRFPNWKATRDGAVKDVKPIVTLNADYILACAKAIKAGSKMPRTVTFWAIPGKEAECAWVITAGGDGKAEAVDLDKPHALIMPARP